MAAAHLAPTTDDKIQQYDVTREYRDQEGSSSRPSEYGVHM